MTQIRSRSRPLPSAPSPVAPVSAPQAPEVPAREEAVQAAPRALVRHEGKISVERVSYDGSVVEHDHIVEVPLFTTAPATVSVKGGVTRNLGDYNSARVDVMVSLPAYPVRSECERAYAIASSWVDEWLEREINIATGVTDVNGVVLNGQV